MNEIFEPDVAVDGPVVNEGERSSSTVSTGQGPRVDLGQGGALAGGGGRRSLRVSR